MGRARDQQLWRHFEEVPAPEGAEGGASSSKKRWRDLYEGQVHVENASHMRRWLCFQSVRFQQEQPEDWTHLMKTLPRSVLTGLSKSHRLQLDAWRAANGLSPINYAADDKHPDFDAGAGAGLEEEAEAGAGGAKRARGDDPEAVSQELTSKPRALGYTVARDPARDAELRARTPFHLALPVADLAAARAFYGGVLGLPEGRSSARWVDYNMWGHQLVCHVVDGYDAASSVNAVDGDPVPVPHFGLAMPLTDFHELVQRVGEHGIRFDIAPHIRFAGAPGEQWTMFFRDPSGNCLEFKSMTQPDNLFAQYTVQ